MRSPHPHIMRYAAVSASMYASQEWGTGYVQTGKPFFSALHLNTLHVHWVWSKPPLTGLAAVKIYSSSMLGMNSSTSRRVVKADMKRIKTTQAEKTLPTSIKENGPHWCTDRLTSPPRSSDREKI
eukprot:1149759-Pelagomonas_calceolata.AAC.5